jgi:hypothetical protein
MRHELLESVISSHQLWLASNGKEGSQAFLTRESLPHVKLNAVCLKKASFFDCDLSYALMDEVDLSETCLASCKFIQAELTGINLSDANCQVVNFENVNLSKANLKRTVFRTANLSGANLSGADLTEASLLEANLSNANLSGANLERTNLKLANLSGANLEKASINLPARNPELIKEIARIVLVEHADFSMGDWHCGSSHCIAGWCSVLSNEMRFENHYLDACAIASYVLGAEAYEHFYDSTDEAKAWLATKL